MQSLLLLAHCFEETGYYNAKLSCFTVDVDQQEASLPMSFACRTAGKFRLCFQPWLVHMHVHSCWLRRSASSARVVLRECAATRIRAHHRFGLAARIPTNQNQLRRKTSDTAAKNLANGMSTSHTAHGWYKLPLRCRCLTSRDVCQTLAVPKYNASKSYVETQHSDPASRALDP